MAHTATKTIDVSEVTVVQRRELKQKSFVFTACRAVSIIAGGWLFVNDQGLWQLLGIGLGVVTFLWIETTIRPSKT